MESHEFEPLDLHDAIFDWAEILWEQKLCRIYIHAFVNRRDNAMPHILEFRGVTAVSMPHREPWGPSFYINSAKCEAGSYQIEMQSGDVIEITAANFSFEPSNHALQPTPQNTRHR